MNCKLSLPIYQKPEITLSSHFLVWKISSEKLPWTPKRIHKMVKIQSGILHKKIKRGHQISRYITSYYVQIALKLKPGVRHLRLPIWTLYFFFIVSQTKNVWNCICVTYLMPTISLNSSSMLLSIYLWKSYVNGSWWDCNRKKSQEKIYKTILSNQNLKVNQCKLETLQQKSWMTKELTWFSKFALHYVTTYATR